MRNVIGSNADFGLFKFFFCIRYFNISVFSKLIEHYKVTSMWILYCYDFSNTIDKDVLSHRYFIRIEIINQKLVSICF